MIKNILFVSLLLAGGTHWASAQSQTTVGAASSLPVSKKENMTISQLFQKVEDNSKSLRTSLSGVEAAHLGIESAKSKKLPDLDASLSFSYIGNALITDRDFSNVHGLKSPHFGNNFAFQAQQVVYAGGAINAGIKLAELGKQQAEVGVKLTRQQIRFIALGQYLDLYKIDNRIKVYEKNIELTRQLIDDIKEKQTHGMALKNDITRYELQMESLKLGLTALRNNRSILNHQLCNTLGMNQDAQIIPDATIADKTYSKEGEAYWQTAGTLNSPLLEQSSNAIRIAEQKEKIAKSDLLPKVAFVAADNFDGPILFELPPVDKNLNVWYVGVGVKLTRQQIRFIALGQYLDLYKIDNRIKVYEKNIELTRQLIDDIKEKQTHGMALKNDITRYELQMESLKLGLTALRNNRSILNHQLCNTLGMNQGSQKQEGSQKNQTSQEIQIIPDASIADKAYGKEGEAYWQTAGTLNSPLLEQSSNAIRIAEQKEKIAKSDLLPKVAFVAADNFDGPILFELPPVDKNLNVWYVGVGVKYSLSSLFKSNKRIKQAAVETRQAKEAHAVQAEQLNNNVQAAYVQYQQTYVELETQRKSVELAQQNYDVMNARYLSQLALVTDMVDASNLKLNAELSEVDARINIVYAYYRMKYVAGEI